MKYAAILLLNLLIFCRVSFAFQSIVVLPFSNESKQQELYWLGEGFAESLSEDILLKDAYVIQRTRRMTAFDELHLPYVGNLSRATMLKIGEKLAADYVVFGNYSLESEELRVSAQVIRLTSSEISPPIQASCKIADLFQVQKQIERGLIQYFLSKKLSPSESGQPDLNSVPLHAYELYIKGLLETVDTEKIKFFARAAESHPGYPQALFRMGVSLSRLQKYKESGEALSRIQGKNIWKTRSDFMVGLDVYLSGDFETALTKWTEMKTVSPSPELSNNIGLVFYNKKEFDNALAHLTEAIQADSDNPDYHYNLSSCHIERNEDEPAISHLKETIRLRPNDHQAFYLLGKLLEKSKSPQAPKIMNIFAEVLPTDQKERSPESYSSALQSLRPAGSFLMPEERKYQSISRDKEVTQRNEYVRTYQTGARRFLERNEPDQAVLEIKKGLTWAPLDWYLNYLWGLAMVKQKNPEGAVSQLEFSVWSLDNVDSRLLLAEIYQEGGDYEASKTQIQQILALDPKNKKALELWNKIWDKVKQ